MKVFLYSEAQKLIQKSGIGKTLSQQIEALRQNGVKTTLDPKDSYDIIDINTVFLRSRSMAKKVRTMGKPVVYHAHSTQEDFRNSFVGSNLLAPFVKKWLKSTYLLGDSIVTPTPYAKKLLQSYGIKKPIHCVSNGANLEFFKYSDEKAKNFRNRYNYKDTDKVIMSVGLYIQRKGILDFVEMAKRMPEYKFIWFGYTPLYSIPAKIRRAVKAEYPNLIFAGYQPSELLCEAYCGADLFWFPTYEETEGIVLLEALASKQNVLIRDIPIYEDWLTDGVNVYKGKNQDDFEEKIRQIVEGNLPDLTQQGYHVAEQRSLKEVGRQLKDIYTSLLDSK